MILIVRNRHNYTVLKFVVSVWSKKFLIVKIRSIYIYIYILENVNIVFVRGRFC